MLKVRRRSAITTSCAFAATATVVACGRWTQRAFAAATRCASVAQTSQLPSVSTSSSNNGSASWFSDTGPPDALLCIGVVSLLAGTLSYVVGSVRTRYNGLPPSTALRTRRRAESTTSPAPVAQEASDGAPVESPFEKGTKDGKSNILTLTWDNVQAVLDDLRPYLQGDGGDCKIVDIDGTVVRLELQGACSSCSASSVTLKMGIEKTLRQRIPEVTEVVAVMPDQERLDEEGVEEVLNGIRPFLSVSGGEIKLLELPDGENSIRIVLQMTGPPLKSMAVRVEVVNRMKRKYPLVQDIDILGPDGKPAGSA